MGSSNFPGPVNQGLPGTDGAGYGGTSATNDVAIGAASGTRALVTQAGLAYVAGSRVRAIDSGNVGNWVEGVVSSYSGTTLVIAVDKVSGSGTPAGWVLSLAGQPGADGEGGGSSTWHGCRVHSSGAVSYTGGSDWQPIPFDTEDEDTDAFHSTSTNPERLMVVAGQAGVFDALGNVGVASNATPGACYARIDVNGAGTGVAYVEMFPDSTANIYETLAVNGLRLAEGDFVTMDFNSGNNQTILHVGTAMPSLSLSRRGD